MALVTNFKKVIFYCAIFFLGTSNYLLADTILEDIQTQFNHIRVVKEQKFVKLYFKREDKLYLETMSDPDDVSSLPLEYIRLMTIGLAYPKQIQQALILGMGGGSLWNYVDRYYPEASLDAVDIDTEIFRIAKQYFKVKNSPKSKMYAVDAWQFIQTTPKKYDIIFSDTYRGGDVPPHLLERKYFLNIYSILNDGGCLTINLHDGIIFKTVMSSLLSIFKKVDYYKSGSNWVVIATKTQLDSSSLIFKAERLQAKFKFPYNIRDLILKYRKTI